jgi:hypothetical protein
MVIMQDVCIVPENIHSERSTEEISVVQRGRGEKFL